MYLMCINLSPKHLILDKVCLVIFLTVTGTSWWWMVLAVAALPLTTYTGPAAGYQPTARGHHYWLTHYSLLPREFSSAGLDFDKIPSVGVLRTGNRMCPSRPHVEITLSHSYSTSVNKFSEAW